jgi:hypothetical protein
MLDDDQIRFFMDAWAAHHGSHYGLLPVSQTPRLGVMMKPEVVHGDEKNIQQRVQA